MTLGARLKYSRENADLTQKAVKEKTNINNKTLSNWEHDVSNPSPADLKTLAELYHVSANYLIGIEDNPHSTTKQTFATPTLPFNLSPEALEIAKIYDAVDSRGKGSIKAVADREYEMSIESRIEDAGSL